MDRNLLGERVTARPNKVFNQGGDQHQTPGIRPTKGVIAWAIRYAQPTRVMHYMTNLHPSLHCCDAARPHSVSARRLSMQVFVDSMAATSALQPPLHAGVWLLHGRHICPPATSPSPCRCLVTPWPPHPPSCRLSLSMQVFGYSMAATSALQNRVDVGGGFLMWLGAMLTSLAQVRSSRCIQQSAVISRRVRGARSQISERELRSQ